MSSVVLINPAVHFANNLGLSRRFAVKVPPLGIAYMAAILDERGDRVVVVDQFAEDCPNGDVLRRIRDAGADVAGFNLLTASATRTKAICLEIRRSMPGVRIVLGNIHASIFHQSILAEGWADVVVHGEGEYVLPRVVDAFRGEGALSDIAGISYRAGDGVETRARDGQIRDLDALPFPAWRLFDLGRYATRTILTFGRMTLPLISSRGCPWNCAFCSQNHFWEKVVRRDARCVAEELAREHARSGCEHFVFHDANFPVTKGYGIEVCDEIRRRGLHEKIGFVTEARLEIFDAELVEALKRAGCRALMFGIESGAGAIRRGIDKRFTNDKVREIVECCRRLSIRTLGLFLVGLPGETAEDFEATSRLARGLPLDLAKFNVVVPYPGSKIFDSLVGSREMKDRDFDKIATFYGDHFAALTVNEHMTSSEIGALQKRALLRFYARPAVIWRLLFSDLLSWGDIAVGALALLKSAALAWVGKVRRPRAAAA